MNGLVPAADLVDRFRADLQSIVGNKQAGLGLAVSGGPDSVAMLLLGQAALPGRVKAATVDHGLRREAADEAEFVGSLCARLGVEHEILRTTTPITGNIQSNARLMRYALLHEWRCRHGLDWLATAHHADDQAETLLMRLNRGSGVAGLASIRSVNGSVIRPLLGWRRTDLEAIVLGSGIDAVADPANRDERFDRARVRRQLRESEWIDPVAVARSAAALGEAETALQWCAAQLWSERAIGGEDQIRLDVDLLPAELRRRLVGRAIQRLAPDSRCRGEDLSRFIATLDKGETATLAGVKGSGGKVWTFVRAAPHRGA